MQTSVTLAESILQLEMFVADDSELEQLGLPNRVTPLLDNLEYVSDWLHLWLLSGQAIDATLGQASRYFQMASFVLADPVELQRVRHLRGLLPEPPTGGTDTIATIRTRTYPVPASLTIEMYDSCAWHVLHHPAQLRRTLMELFVQSPAIYRFDFT